jgi:hypothetical protein
MNYLIDVAKFQNHTSETEVPVIRILRRTHVRIADLVNVQAVFHFGLL